MDVYEGEVLRVHYGNISGYERRQVEKAVLVSIKENEYDRPIKRRRGEVVYYKTFCLDTEGCADIDFTRPESAIEEWSRVDYERAFDDPVDMDTFAPSSLFLPLEVSAVPLPESQRMRCFNCDKEGHSLQQCTAPFNKDAVNKNKLKWAIEQENKLTLGRYFVEEVEVRFPHLEAGTLSQRLRLALGIYDQSDPPFLKNMQKYGYPPGYFTPVRGSNKRGEGRGPSSTSLHGGGKGVAVTGEVGGPVAVGTGTDMDMDIEEENSAELVCLFCNKVGEHSIRRCPDVQALKGKKGLGQQGEGTREELSAMSASQLKQLLIKRNVPVNDVLNLEKSDLISRALDTSGPSPLSSDILVLEDCNFVDEEDVNGVEGVVEVLLPGFVYPVGVSRDRENCLCRITDVVPADDVYDDF